MSPIYFLSPSFILFNVKDIVQKNVKKFPFFCYKIKTRAKNKNLRHRSPHIYSNDKLIKSHSCV